MTIHMNTHDLNGLIKNSRQKYNLEDFFTPRFMDENTDFATIQQFFNDSKWETHSQEAYDAIPREAGCLRKSKYRV